MTRLFSHLAIAALFILLPFQVRAELISTITDTDTGLSWLPLTDTLDMSFLQVSAQLGPGGEFARFRYATVAEVETLWADAGVSGPNLGCNPAAVCLNQSPPKLPKLSPVGFLHSGTSSVLILLAIHFSYVLPIVGYDLWSTRKIQRATLWGSAFFIVLEVIKIPIGFSSAWNAFATWVSVAR